MATAGLSLDIGKNLSATQHPTKIDSAILDVLVQNTNPIPVVGTMTGGLGFSTVVSANPSVSNVDSIIIASNSGRKYARIANFSSTPVWLQYGGPAISGQGILLRTNSVWTINSTELYLGDIHAITDGPTINLSTMEGT